MSRPAREPGETVHAYVERLGLWEQTIEGREYEAEIAEQRARDAEAERAHQRRELVKHAQIPNHYLRQFAARPPAPTEAMLAVQQKATLLVLAGLRGCGKTTAALAWLMDYINAPVTPYRAPRFTTAAALARGNKYDEGRMSGLLSAPRLVIDDLGMEYADERGFFASTLDELIDGRYSAERPVVITTNLVMEKFVLRYGERIRDRIRESGAYVELSNASLRGGAS